MLTSVIIVVLLILLNALFVAAEFSFLSVPRTALEQMGTNGHMVAGRLAHVLKTPQLQDRYIATAQLGVTFASLGLGLYGEAPLAEWLQSLMAGAGQEWVSWLMAHGAATIIALSVLTYLHIVLGEMVPKALTLQHAIKLSLLIYMPMCVIQFCLYPLVVGLNVTGTFCLKLIGIDRNESKSYYHSAEELQYIIEESHEKGALPEESGRIMDSLFDMDDLYVHQVMTPRVRMDAIPENAAPEQIRQIVSATRRTRYPVYRGNFDCIIGMVHARDLFRLMAKHEPLTADCIHAVPKVPHTVKFDNVVEIMRKDNARMAVIMDEQGGTAGLLTLTDVFTEVMEWDRGRICMLNDLSAEEVGYACDVSGLARIEDLAEAFAIEVKNEEVDTVGGLILDLLQAPAKEGDVVTAMGLEFKVSQVVNGGVKRCVVTRKTPLVREEEEEA